MSIIHNLGDSILRKGILILLMPLLYSCGSDSASSLVAVGPDLGTALITPTPTESSLSLGTLGNASIGLSWTTPSGLGDFTYSIYRGTTAGGESSTAIATGIHGTSWTDNVSLDVGNAPTNGTTYYYKIKAIGINGTSLASNEVSGTPYGTPTAATLTLGVVGNASVGLSWSAPTGFGSLTYNIYRGTSASGESTTAIATGIHDTSWTDNVNLDVGNAPINATTYYYEIEVVGVGGTSPLSNEVSGTPYDTPTAPTLSLGTIASASIGFSWTAPVGFGSLTYSIYRGTSASGESATAIASGISGTTWTDNSGTGNPANGTTYYYEMKATGIGGTSVPSNEISAALPTIQFSDTSGLVGRNAYSLLSSLCSSGVSGCANTSTVGFPVGTPITLSRVSSGSLYSVGSHSVTLTITGVTALSGTQFTPTSSTITVTFGAGDTTKVIDSSNFGIVANATVTADTYFTIAISAPTNGAAVGSNAIAQINLIDPNYISPTYSSAGDILFSNSFFSSNPGDTSVKLVVQRAFNTGTNETVQINFMDGTGVSSTDYSPASATGTGYTPATQTLLFNNGDKEKTISVPISPKTNGDNTSFYARISKVSTFTGTATSGSTTISGISPTAAALMIAGQQILGFGIPSGTTISSVSATSIVISQAANATLSSGSNNFMAVLSGSTRGQSMAKVRITSTNSGTLCNATASPFGGGLGTSGSPYLICSMTQLSKASGSYCDGTNAAVGGLSSSGSSCNSSSFSFKLMADMTWANPASTFASFNANLDGNQSILYNYTNASGQALIQNISSDGQTLVKNINLLNGVVSGGSANGIAVFVGTNGSSSGYAATLTDNFASGYLNPGSYSYSGMLVGQNQLNSSVAANATIQTGMTSGLIVGSLGSVGLGGVLGGINFSSASTSPVIDIKNCYSTVNITNINPSATTVTAPAAGIAAYLALSGNISGGNFTNNIASGRITSVSTQAGGVFGSISFSKTSTSATYAANYNFNGNLFTGTAGLNASGSANVGGIIDGLIAKNTSTGSGLTVTVDSNVNTGAITGAANLGGIAGYIGNTAASTGARGTQLSLTNNLNYGIVTGNNVAAVGGGGIAGYVQCSSCTGTTFNFANNSNFGAINYSYSSTGGYMGGLVGIYSDSNYASLANVAFNMSNSWNSGAITATTAVASKFLAGGIAYFSGGRGTAGSNNTISITQNISTGNVTAATTASATGNIGGFFAYLGTKTYDTVTVSNNTSTGNVNCGGAAYCGGFIGLFSNVAGSAWLRNNSSSGSVTGGANYLGGFVGAMAGVTGGVITGSHATGDVSTAADIPYVGGFIGYSAIGSITYSYASGNISDAGHSSNSVGGFIGYAKFIYISNSWASGSVSGNATANAKNANGGAVGGFVGLLDNGATITQSYATGGVSGVVGGSPSVLAGGFVGLTLNGSNSITYSYTAASVTNGSGFVGAVSDVATYTHDYWLENGAITDSVLTSTLCDNSVASGSRCTSAQLGSPTNSSWDFASWDYLSGTTFNGTTWYAPNATCTSDANHACPTGTYAYPTLHL